MTWMKIFESNGEEHELVKVEYFGGFDVLLNKEFMFSVRGLKWSDRGRGKDGV